MEPVPIFNDQMTVNTLGSLSTSQAVSSMVRSSTTSERASLGAKLSPSADDNEAAAFAMQEAVKLQTRQDEEFWQSFAKRQQRGATASESQAPPPPVQEQQSTQTATGSPAAGGRTPEELKRLLSGLFA